MPYTAIIFDFFDVVHNDPFLRWLKSHGLKREGALHEASVELDKGRITTSEFFDRLQKLTDQSASEIADEMTSFHGYDQDVMDLIRILSKDYRVGLLSNGPSGFVRELLTNAGIEDAFHHIVISSEVGMVKPDPEIFQHILSRMSAKPNTTIFIDDNPKNVAAAVKLGICGIQFVGIQDLRVSLQKLGVKLSES